ncbi:MAG: alpha-L-fucosidase [Phycisphaera sp.]|nr:alpha-L-fucosidase [Phycisphaera sp.]
MLETLKTPGDTSWFTHDRFGLFIHWGLYALGARHEWLKNNEKITNEVYDEKYFKRFDPDLYDPNLWAKAASGAGMKYFVITTKHHEGFCLWDSKHTDYKATNTPAKRDLLSPMVDAFRSRDMRVGFYHSVIDWHHPHYVIDDRIGPYRTAENKDELNKGRDQNKYADYLHAQVRELLTQFGKVDVLWFDFSYPFKDNPADHTRGKSKLAWRSEELYKMIRELAPHIMLDDRLDLPDGWDMKTPEQFQPREWVTVNGQPVVWEGCQTFSGSWGYHRDEQSWKSTEQLIIMLIDSVSKGGNLLLNVGPTARGEFDERALERLNGIGEWMRRHSRSIYGCTQAPAGFKAPQDCRLTYNPTTKRMYVHVLSWPFGGTGTAPIHLDGFRGKVDYAQLLNDGSELMMRDPVNHHGAGTASSTSEEDSIRVMVPIRKPNVTVPVIELFMK